MVPPLLGVLLRGTIQVMNRTVLAVLLLVLAFLGIADAWYLSATALTDSALSCDFGVVLDGCNVVAQSEYSRLLGVPVALYGVFFYGLFFVLTALLFVFRSIRLERGIYLLATTGAASSVVLLLIQFVFIRAICVYCVVSAGIAFLMFAVSRAMWKQHKAPVVLQAT